MSRFELSLKPPRCDAPRRVSLQPERVGNGSAQEGIAERGEHQPGRGFADVMLLMADTQLRDEGTDRFQDRVERIAVARDDHPCCERAGTLPIEGVEGSIHDLAGIGFMRSGTADGFRDAVGNPVGDGARELCLKASGRSEVMEQVCVGTPDLRSDGLQGHRLRALFEQQQSCRFECRGPAFFGV